MNLFAIYISVTQSFL